MLSSVVVIGAGQAGLSAAYHLLRRGFVSAVDFPQAGRNVVLDHETGPGGAWRPRWESLTMATVNGIFDLPGLPEAPRSTPTSRAASPCPATSQRSKTVSRPPILRPEMVGAVRPDDDDPDGDLVIDTDRVNGGRGSSSTPPAPGPTRCGPISPAPPSPARQLHTHDYTRAADFAGRRVEIVGGGISAIQHLAEISRVATTFWYTRRVPEFRDSFTPDEGGRQTIDQVRADVEAGRPTRAWSPIPVCRGTVPAGSARPGRAPAPALFTAVEPDGSRRPMATSPRWTRSSGRPGFAPAASGAHAAAQPAGGHHDARHPGGRRATRP